MRTNVFILQFVFQSVIFSLELHILYEHTKIKKEEAKIDWSQDALMIDRQIRALNPSPGATTTLDGEIFKIWLSENISNQWPNNLEYSPGEIIEMSDLGICVAGKNGVIRLLEIQKAGSKRVSAAQFYKGNQIKLGQVFK